MVKPYLKMVQIALFLAVFTVGAVSQYNAHTYVIDCDSKHASKAFSHQFVFLKELHHKNTK